MALLGLEMDFKLVLEIGSALVTASTLASAFTVLSIELSSVLLTELPTKLSTELAARVG